MSPQTPPPGPSPGPLHVRVADDILLLPADLASFKSWLPLDGGNRTVVLAGARPGPSQTVLDFGGEVGLLYHPAGHSFFAYNLQLQGLAPASAGVAAGMLTQVRLGAWVCACGACGPLTGLAALDQNCAAKRPTGPEGGLPHGT